MTRAATEGNRKITGKTRNKAEETDGAVVSGLMLLYAIAFLITGALFVVMSLPSISNASGKLAMGSGIACIIGAAVFYSKRKSIKPAAAQL